MINFSKINAHLVHAVSKHQHFVDRMLSDNEILMANVHLKRIRIDLELEKCWNAVCATTVLECEVAEMVEAIMNGRTDDAVEEAYDAIAVLLRIIDRLKEKGCK